MAKFDHLPTAQRQMLHSRYGISERGGWKLAAIIVLAIATPWFIWSAWHHSNPPFRVSLISFAIINDRSISITYQVDRRDPSKELTCTLIARDFDKNVAGEIDQRIPPTQSRSTSFTTRIPTRLTPVNADILRCFTDED
jgi:hypothetical protein